ncbi:MAG: hypothetical protein JO061_07940 [Acidobacteriaceae bacterium]|nr:hypothetical protein [Acidobacteriaceae bacterium]
MTPKWLQTETIRTASLLVPSDERGEWVEWWCSELWYVSPREATRFCAGAFRDALWVRRNSSLSGKRTRRFRSPFACLAVLGTLSVPSIWITNRLEGMLPFRVVHGMSAVAGLCDVLFFYLILAAVAFIIRDSPGNRRPVPRPNTARSWVFLGVKIGLVLPILHCAMVAIVVVNLPPLSLAFFAGCVLLFRWIFADQLRRCPVCLRLLNETVRIGTPAQTFLSWYGGESMCARGHGFLHAPGAPATYSREPKWIDLNDSWRALQSKAAGFR